MQVQPEILQCRILNLGHYDLVFTFRSTLKENLVWVIYFLILMTFMYYTEDFMIRDKGHFSRSPDRETPRDRQCEIFRSRTYTLRGSWCHISYSKILCRWSRKL